MQLFSCVDHQIIVIISACCRVFFLFYARCLIKPGYFFPGWQCMLTNARIGRGFSVSFIDSKFYVQPLGHLAGQPVGINIICRMFFSFHKFLR